MQQRRAGLEPRNTSAFLTALYFLAPTPTARHGATLKSDANKEPPLARVPSGKPKKIAGLLEQAGAR
jgi:hypothetical protein